LSYYWYSTSHFLAMKPDQHKRAQSKRYQKANPEAAAVAADRRNKRREGKEGAAAASPSSAPPTASSAVRSQGNDGDAGEDDAGGAPWKQKKQLTSNAFRYGGDGEALVPEEDAGGGDEGDGGADLEAMLAELDGTDASVAHFRFAAEGAWDPVELLAQAGVVGATDRHAAPPARSAIWPNLATLARELGSVPLHEQLGVDREELAYRFNDEHTGERETTPMRGEALEPKQGGGAVVGFTVGNQAQVPVVVAAVEVDDAHTSAQTGGNDSDEDLEGWLDSVL
jgi:hypothetical protein